MFGLVKYVRHLNIMPLIHRPHLLKTHNSQIKEVDEKWD